jgi:hypothetical protein
VHAANLLFLERLEVLDQIALLARTEADVVETGIVVIDDFGQRGEATVVKEASFFVAEQAR